jgi:hypothetical protein
MSDHEHAGHPRFCFEVTAECIIADPARWTWHIGDGNTKPMTAQEIESNKHESHALIYTDGHIAVTLYEHCYAMWRVSDGTIAGGSLWNKGEWRLTPESVTRIQKACAP